MFIERNKESRARRNLGKSLAHAERKRAERLSREAYGVPQEYSPTRPGYDAGATKPAELITPAYYSSPKELTPGKNTQPAPPTTLTASPPSATGASDLHSSPANRLSPRLTVIRYRRKAVAMDFGPLAVAHLGARTHEFPNKGDSGGVTNPRTLNSTLTFPGGSPGKSDAY